MSYENKLAALVSQAIEASPYSIKYVAEQSAIARQTLGRKMKGGGEFTVPEIHKIAKVLGVPMSHLIPNVNEETPLERAS